MNIAKKNNFYVPQENHMPRIFKKGKNEILNHLSQGATYKNILNNLYVTPSTIIFTSKYILKIECATQNRRP